MTPRFRLTLAVGLVAFSGCNGFRSEPISYVENARLTSEEFKDKPKLQKAVRARMIELFGPSPQQIRVFADSGLTGGGVNLANYIKLGPDDKKTHSNQYVVTDAATGKPVLRKDGTPETRRREGGYALYRLHCLHCHGVSGDGNGSTAPFLYPRPRDYRKGVFKFTSTTNGAKPTRDDLRKTIKYGLLGTSMPAFEALMTEPQIEQVIDYVIFLSMRGEVEQALIEEASVADDNDAESALAPETALEIAQNIAGRWKQADEQVVDPPVPRSGLDSRGRATRASIRRGRDLFLGRPVAGGGKVDCTSCHGVLAEGNGPSFVDKDLFYRVMFWDEHDVIDEFDQLTVLDLIQGKVSSTKKSVGIDELPKTIPGTADGRAPHTVSVLKLVEELEAKGYLTRSSKGSTFEVAPTNRPQDEPALAKLRKRRDQWKASLDDWQVPLRPANLNLGRFKGGRRPIDLYWRIANGINGVKMPGHANAIKPDQIWDLVNFVLELHYDPDLLRDAVPAGGASPPAVAQH